MSESPIGPVDETKGTGTYVIIRNWNGETITPWPEATTNAVTGYGEEQLSHCANSDAIAKEEKRKADHEHNLRLQKARKHGGRMKNPW